MKYEGQAIQTFPLDGGFVELKFDLKTDSVNKFNALTMGELKEVVEGLTKAPPKGLLVTSGKDVFIVGADVTEFLGHFKRTEEELTAWLLAGRRGLQRHRGPPLPVGRRAERLLPRRRLRARALGALPGGVDGGEGRGPRDEARHLPGLGRHGPPLADVRRRQRHRVDRHRRAVPGRGRAEDRRDRRRLRARQAPRGRPPDAPGRRRRQARLEGPPRREEGAPPAQQDRGGDGLRRGQGVRRRQGRSELPVPRRRDRGDAEGGRTRTRRSAEDRGGDFREDREDADGPRPRLGLPRRSARQEVRPESGKGGEAGRSGRPFSARESWGAASPTSRRRRGRRS